MFWTNAIQIEAMPNMKVVAGMNHPGPIFLQEMLHGISKMMYEM